MTAILEPPTTATESPAPVVRQQPVLPPAAPPPVAPAPRPREPEAREPRVRRTLTPTGVRLIGAALVALFTVGYVVEPAPDGSEPALSLTAQVLGTVMTVLLVAALVGFLRGRRWALPTSLAFGGLMAVNVALCPTTGHHELAGWWFAQVGVVAAMIALPALALARTRAG
jgi:hypothetical protein